MCSIYKSLDTKKLTTNFRAHLKNILQGGDHVIGRDGREDEYHESNVHRVFSESAGQWLLCYVTHKRTASRLSITWMRLHIVQIKYVIYTTAKEIEICKCTLLLLLLSVALLLCFNDWGERGDTFCVLGYFVFQLSILY